MESQGKLLTSGLVDEPSEGRALDVRVDVLHEVASRVVETEIKRWCSTRPRDLEVLTLDGRCRAGRGIEGDTLGGNRGGE